MITQIGVDLTGDGNSDLIIEPKGSSLDVGPSYKKQRRRRWWSVGRLLSSITRKLRVDSLATRFLRWVSFRATKKQLSVVLQLTTGALALAELREEIDNACAAGECSVGTREGLEIAVEAVEVELERALELALKEMVIPIRTNPNHDPDNPSP